MPGVLLDHYEEEYVSLSSNIAEKLVLIQEPKPSQVVIQGLQSDLKAAAQILDQMEIEVLGIDHHQRASEMAQLASFKSDLKRFQEEAKAALGQYSSGDAGGARSQLFGTLGGRAGDIEAGMSPPTEHLLSGYDQLGRDAHEKLERTHRMALEAEQIGASVLSDLRIQREQINRASTTLGNADTDLDKSNRLLRDMLRRTPGSSFSSSSSNRTLASGTLEG